MTVPIQQGGNGQAPTSQAPNGQAPTEPPSAAPQSGNQPGQAPTGGESLPSADDWKRHQQELAEARRDAAKARDEAKKLTDAQLTAEQKRERDFADLQAKQFEWEAERQNLYLTQAIGNQMASAGIQPQFTASEIASLLTANGIDVTFEDNGRPKDIAKQLKTLVELRPFLAAAQAGAPNGTPPRPPAGAGGATNPGRTSSATPRTLDDFAKMSPAEYDAHRDEYLALMRTYQRRR